MAFSTKVSIYGVGSSKRKKKHVGYNLNTTDFFNQSF